MTENRHNYFDGFVLGVCARRGYTHTRAHTRTTAHIHTPVRENSSGFERLMRAQMALMIWPTLWLSSMSTVRCESSMRMTFRGRCFFLYSRRSCGVRVSHASVYECAQREQIYSVDCRIETRHSAQGFVD